MRIAMLLLAFLLFTGCSAKQDGKPDPDSADLTQTADADTEQTDRVTEIVDRNGRRLGEIARSGAVTVTDSGILYTVHPEGSSEDITEYRMYSPETDTDTLLGTVGESSYEAAYSRVELGGKIYTLIVTGNALDDKADPLLLLELDPKGSMTTHKLSDNGFPYTAMCAVNGRLIILNHDQEDVLHDRLLEFDPQTGSVREVLMYELSHGNKGDTLRHMYSDGEYIYILRLAFDGDENIRMLLDTYDMSYRKQAEKDLTALFTEAAEKVVVPEDIPNEMKQMISRFAVIDGRYIYYENFSITRFFADLNNDELLMDTNVMFMASLGSGEIFWYWILGNRVYPEDIPFNRIVELKNGSFETSDFYDTADRRYELVGASSSPNGSRLIVMYYKDPNTGEVLPEKLYYLQSGDQ